MVSVTIDGRRVRAPDGATVLEAALRAGIEIPHLCHHEGIRPYGACRLCTVEITQGARTRLQASCTYPVAAGLEVRTDTPRVLRGRRIILELLLARCPDVRGVREYARRWGVRKTRFESTEGEDCILCGLCVRGCHEVIGADALGFVGRGVGRKVEVPFGLHPESCIGCGLCTYLCPTGKAQMEAKTAERLRQAAGTERTCRYMLMGLVSTKTCPENVHCWQCPYDQFMEQAAGTHPALLSPPAQAAGPVAVGPFTLSPDRAYARNHTWVRGTDGVVVVGVDDFLCGLLGPVDEVEVAGGQVRLAAGRRRLALPLPVPGEVLKVNPEVEAVPRLVGFSPYRRGWLAVVRSEGAARGDLLSGRAAVRWLRQELGRLERLGGLGRRRGARSSARPPWRVLKKAFFERAE